MTESSIEPWASAEGWAIARRVCTDPELEVVRLQRQGASQHMMAHSLGIARSSVRDRLRSARRKVEERIGADAVEARAAAAEASPGGDEESLRGIPAIGRGVSGAIRGTSPEREVLRGAERRLSREERLASANRAHERHLRRLRTRRFRKLVIERDSSTCHVCGKVCEPAEIHLYHVVPIGQGGHDGVDNLAVACASCSVRKDSGRVYGG